MRNTPLSRTWLFFSRSCRYIAVVITALGCAAALSSCGKTKPEQASSGLSAEAAAGKRLFEAKCSGCHTTNGRASSGPTMRGLAGSQVALTDGRTVTADDTYLLRAIQAPSADVVRGYPKSVMETATPPGSVTDADAQRMVDYIKTLTRDAK